MLLSSCAVYMSHTLTSSVSGLHLCTDPPPSPCTPASPPSPPPAPPPAFQESVVSAWVDQGTMSQVQQNKLVFIETQDFVETTVALENYIKVKGGSCYVCMHIPSCVSRSSSTFVYSVNSLPYLGIHAWEGYTIQAPSGRVDNLTKQSTHYQVIRSFSLCQPFPCTKHKLVHKGYTVTFDLAAPMWQHVYHKVVSAVDSCAPV